jgi:hypothetical protein
MDVKHPNLGPGMHFEPVYPSKMGVRSAIGAPPPVH